MRLGGGWGKRRDDRVSGVTHLRAPLYRDPASLNPSVARIISKRLFFVPPEDATCRCSVAQSGQSSTSFLGLQVRAVVSVNPMTRLDEGRCAAHGFVIAYKRRSKPR
jgi:hypothetical protein